MKTKDKGIITKHKPYLKREKQAENLENITYIHIGKDKGRTEKQKKGKTAKNKTLFSQRVKGKKKRKKNCGAVVNCLTQFTMKLKRRKKGNY